MRPSNCFSTVVLYASVLGLALLLPRTVAADDIFAVQSRLSTPNFQLFLELNDDSSVLSSGPLFSPAGGVYGMTFHDDTVYAIELENGTFVDYLATIPHEGFFVGQGSRVGTSSVGFPSVESLASANGQLLATSLDFSAHMTTLISIDATTGVGTAIGTGDRDVMIVGLAYDPTSATLFGAGTPFGTLVDDPNLYTLDMNTGATSLIGNMGHGIQSLTWHEDLGLIGAFDQLYQIDTTTGAASVIGAGNFTDGMPATFNGIYSLASPAPTVVAPGCDLNTDGSCTIADLDILYAQPGLTDQQIFDWLADASSVDPQGREFRTGDTNLDGMVDFPDFLALSGNFNAGPTSTWGMGNFNADGIVDFADFLALSSNFGFVAATTTSVQTVPEPELAPCLITCLGLALMARSRRSRIR